MRSTSSLLLLVLLGGAAPVSLGGLCPKTQGDEIVSRERNGLFDYDNGGIGTCSTTGAGGASGCSYREHMRNVNQRANARDRRGRV